MRTLQKCSKESVAGNCWRKILATARQSCTRNQSLWQGEYEPSFRTNFTVLRKAELKVLENHHVGCVSAEVAMIYPRIIGPGWSANMKTFVTRWFNVTFWSPSWRSLKHLKGSLTYPNKSPAELRGYGNALTIRGEVAKILILWKAEWEAISPSAIRRFVSNECYLSISKICQEYFVPLKTNRLLN